MYSGLLTSNRRILVILLLLSIAYGSAFFYLRTQQYRSFFSYEWEDDARENQTVYNISQHHLWHQTIMQDKNPRFLNDFFSPVYFFIALFYKFFPHIYTWYFLMSFSYGLSSLVLYVLTKKMLKSAHIAFLVSLIYLIYPPLHYINLGALDARNFILPFLYLALYFLFEKKYVFYMLCVIFASFCMEDASLVIAGLGIYSFARGYSRKWWLATILFACTYFIIAQFIAYHFCRIKGLMCGDQLNYVDIKHIKEYFSVVIKNKEGLSSLLLSLPKFKTFLMIFLPLLFLPVFSVEVYIPMVAFLEIILANRYGLPNANSYYLTSAIPFVFISLVFVFKRLIYRFGERKVIFISFIIIGVSILSNFSRNIIGLAADESPVMKESNSNLYDRKFLGVRNIFDKRFFVLDEEDKLAWEFISLIPKDASVVATGDLLPALSSRKEIHEFGLNNPKAEQSFFSGSGFLASPTYSVDYFLINKKCLINGLGGHYAFFPRTEDLDNEILKLINEYRFRIIKQKDNFILLTSTPLKEIFQE